MCTLSNAIGFPGNLVCFPGKCVCPGKIYYPRIANSNSTYREDLVGQLACSLVDRFSVVCRPLASLPVEQWSLACRLAGSPTGPEPPKCTSLAGRWASTSLFLMLFQHTSWMRVAIALRMRELYAIEGLTVRSCPSRAEGPLRTGGPLPAGQPLRADVLLHANRDLRANRPSRASELSQTGGVLPDSGCLRTERPSRADGLPRASGSSRASRFLEMVCRVVLSSCSLVRL